MMDAPDGFVWEHPDEMTLRCTDCDMLVRAGVLDLHTCP